MSRLKSFLRWVLCVDPPKPERTAEQEYAWKRERLRRAVAVGDVAEVKRLTKELAGR